MKVRWEPPRTRRLADPAEVQGITERLVEFFDWVAPEYDEWAGGLHTRAGARLVDLIRPEAKERALDVGCGTGAATRLLAEKVGTHGAVVGVDISPGMLERARNCRLPNTMLMLRTA